MTSLKILSVLVLVSTGIMLLSALGGSSEEVMGFWVLATLGLAVAQSIVLLVKSK